LGDDEGKGQRKSVKRRGKTSGEIPGKRIAGFIGFVGRIKARAGIDAAVKGTAFCPFSAPRSCDRARVNRQVKASSKKIR
jgi:hypothetical protein